MSRKWDLFFISSWLVFLGFCLLVWAAIAIIVERAV